MPSPRETILWSRFFLLTCNYPTAFNSPSANLLPWLPLKFQPFFSSFPYLISSGGSVPIQSNCSTFSSIIFYLSIFGLNMRTGWYDVDKEVGNMKHKEKTASRSLKPVKRRKEVSVEELAGKVWCLASTIRRGIKYYEPAGAHHTDPRRHWHRWTKTMRFWTTIQKKIHYHEKWKSQKLFL